MSKYSPIMTIMMRAADKASRFLQRDFSELLELQNSRKGTFSFAQKSYEKAKDVITRELNILKPDCSISFEGENLDLTKSPDHFHIIPIDGLENLLHAVPFFASVIVLERANNLGEHEIAATLISAPATGEIFLAEKGLGAWYEKYVSGDKGLRIRVSHRNDMDAMIATETCFAGDYKLFSRNMGCDSLSVAYAAAGRFDAAVIGINNEIASFAGQLLITEAGGAKSELNDRIIFHNNVLKGKLHI
jgi:myo-inositol-1(or 4)-monophosphatase